MKPKVIIGRDYWPQPTLRQLPRYTHLSDSKPARKPLTPDAWVVVAAVLGAVVMLVQCLQGWV